MAEATSNREQRAGQRGAGVFGLVSGVLVFLLLLLFAVQLTYNLSARSHVTAASYSAARVVAGYRSDAGRAAAAGDAGAQLRDRLGRMGEEATIEWDLARPDVVRLRVAVALPSIAPPFVQGALGLEQIDRTIEVRVEEPLW